MVWRTLIMWVMDSMGVPLRSVLLSVTVTVSEKD